MLSGENECRSVMSSEQRKFQCCLVKSNSISLLTCFDLCQFLSFKFTSVNPALSILRPHSGQTVKLVLNWNLWIKRDSTSFDCFTICLAFHNNTLVMYYVVLIPSKTWVLKWGVALKSTPKSPVNNYLEKLLAIKMIIRALTCTYV